MLFQDHSSEPLYDWGGAAEYCHTTTKKLRNWHRTKRGPSYIKPSPRVVLFRQRDLDDWLAGWQRVKR
jgi:hypothetical protein